MNVSVVVPAFNRSKFLRKAIESVLGQTVQPLEVIVVDHGSTDETPEVIASFGKAVHGLRLGESGRGGPAVPRNAGIRSSRGEWLAFLDDDDAWEPQRLERQLQELRKVEPAWLASSDAWLIDSYDNLLGGRYLSHTSGKSGDVFRDLAHDNHLITSSVLVRRAAVMEVGGFDERSLLHKVEDYHLWLRLAARGPFIHIDEPLVRYRRDGGESSTGDLLNALRSRRTVLRLALEDEKVSLRSVAIRKAIARDYARSAISVARRGA